MIIVRSLLLLGLVLVAPAFAEEGGATIYGAGAVSCGQWQKDLAIRVQAEAWIDGFLSGYNLASTGPDFLADTPNDNGASFSIWIDNYCRSNPIDRLTTAVFALKNELLSRAR